MVSNIVRAISYLDADKGPQGHSSEKGLQKRRRIGSSDGLTQGWWYQNWWVPNYKFCRFIVQSFLTLFECIAGPEIDCTSIGRRLEDFPEMVEDHNKAVAQLEEHLVKYLKNNQMASKRPQIRKGGFLGMGGVKKVSFDSLLQLGITSWLGCEGRDRLPCQRNQVPEGEDRH